MLQSIIVRVAITAAQKSGAKVASKVGTTIASSLAGYAVQSTLTKSQTKKVQALADSGNLSEKDIKNANAKVILGSAVGAGVCAGIGMVANNGINNYIDTL